MTGELIQVDFRKWPDAKHWQYTMHHLGADEHGRWLWAPARNIAYRGEEGPIFLPNASVKLVSRDWWAANFIVEPNGSRFVYVDIIAPATWSDGRVTMIDLDLDVWANRSNGECRMLDEDEFLENQRLRQYPAHLIAGAETAARSVFEAVAAQREPFGEIGWQWLATAPAAS